MRKFRFGDPNSRKFKARFWFNLVQFVVVWHVIGKLFVNRRKDEIDPDFDKKSRVEKMLILMGRQDTQVKVAQVKVTPKGVTYEIEEIEKTEKKDDKEAIGGAASEW